MAIDNACPKCRNIALRLPVNTGTPVRRCYDCGGMWLSADEADQLLEEGEILDPESMLPGMADHLDGISGLCPDGHGILTRSRVYAGETFYIERCATCHGLWFDAGEWDKLAANQRLQDLHALWDPEHQKRMRAEEAERLHLEKLCAMLGDHLVDDIEALAAKLRRHDHRGTAVAFLLELVEKR